jgi:hypothetical protein
VSSATAGIKRRPWADEASVLPLCYKSWHGLKERHDTQHNDIFQNSTQHKDILHNNTQNDDIQHAGIQNDDIQHDDIQHNNK